MAAKKHGHLWLWVLLAAGAAGGGYWYYKQQQKKKAAAQATSNLSSNQAQGVAPLPLNLPSPMEYPNSMAGTPTIQNFVSSTEPTPTTSQQTTIIQPIISAFHHKPHNFHPPHPPHSPHMGGRGGGDHRGGGRH